MKNYNYILNRYSNTYIKDIYLFDKYIMWSSDSAQLFRMQSAVATCSRLRLGRWRAPASVVTMNSPLKSYTAENETVPIGHAGCHCVPVAHSVAKQSTFAQHSFICKRYTQYHSWFIK